MRAQPILHSLRALALAAVVAAVAGCSSMHYAINVPLPAARGEPGCALRHLHTAGNSDSLLVLLSFSGGGYRAAAMAHAVLEVLHETPLYWDGEPTTTTLLQEVDAISAVSGGSLAAAYYAMDPGHLFPRFREQVLNFDLQGALLARALSPAGLWRQTSTTYGQTYACRAGDVSGDEPIEHDVARAGLAPLNARQGSGLEVATSVVPGQRPAPIPLPGACRSVVHPGFDPPGARR